MKPEILLACPICEQSGFTRTGLRAHVCKRKPAPVGSNRRGAQLTKTEYQAAVDLAERRIK
jgi:hypothetical protein